jgi:hypothetical protein
MKEYALFIGCTIATRGLNYEVSARKVAEAFGIKFVDIPAFGCCGMRAGRHHPLFGLYRRPDESIQEARRGRKGAGAHQQDTA